MAKDVSKNVLTVLAAALIIVSIVGTLTIFNEVGGFESIHNEESAASGHAFIFIGESSEQQDINSGEAILNINIIR